MPELADARARQEALDPRRSFIVQAPAGSGKTALLVLRVLTLLAGAQAPEEVVAITFTRKAAAEMHGRVLDALRLAQEPAPADAHAQALWQAARAVLEQDRRLGWDLAQHPGRLRLTTFDGLCSLLAGQMPWVSRLGAAPAIAERPQELYLQAARATLDLLGAPGAAGQAAAILLRHLDNQVQTAAGLLAGLLQRREQWLRHLQDEGSESLRRALETALADTVTAGLHAARTALVEIPGLEERLPPLLRYAGANLSQQDAQHPGAALATLQRLPPAQAESLGLWQALAEVLLTASGAWRKPKGVTAAQGFPAPAKGSAGQAARDAKDALAQLLGTLQEQEAPRLALEWVRCLPPPRYSPAQWQALRALLTLLPLAVQRLRSAFQAAGQADFAEVALAAQSALGSARQPTPLVQALDHRVQHLLVDEFQDSSQSQFRLLEQLTALWQPGDGHTLFLVGDPMQSIYRFREAEVGLFLRARRLGIGPLRLEPLTLTVNFRAQAGLVEWINPACARMFPAQEDEGTGAIGYVPAQARRPAEPGPAVHVHPLLEGGPAGAEGTPWPQVEARQVAQLVREALRQGQRVAVLVRARAHLEHILPALRAAGLPCRAVEIEPLALRQEVLDLVALTQALLLPAHRPAWLAVLRAPWCGLTLADLLALAGPDARVTLWEQVRQADDLAGLSAEGLRRLRRVREVLGPALDLNGRLTLRHRVEGTWLALGGPAGLNSAQVANACAYLDLLDEVSLHGHQPSLEELDAALEGLFAAPDPQADDRVQAMSIHKAKGLEFDTVILPGMGRPPRRDERTLLRWMELPTASGPQLLLAPLGAIGEEADPIFSYLGRLEDRRAEHELRRLVYVALTRAKRQVHLLGHASLKDGELLPPRGTSLLGPLWPSVEAEFAAAAQPALEEPSPREEPPAPPVAPEPEPDAPLWRLPAGWQPPPWPPALTAGAALRQPTPDSDEVPEFLWAGDEVRKVGVVVHRLLQKIGRTGPAAWSPERLEQERPVIARLLRQLGVEAGGPEGPLAHCLRALRQVLADARGRWVLEAHPEGRVEWELTLQESGQARPLRIDRGFLAPDGTLWVVDYKVSTHQGREDITAFLANEQERYRAAMERYGLALWRLEPGRPIRLALLFPLVQVPGGALGWREWEFVPPAR